jgi:hypothetical protein
MQGRRSKNRLICREKKQEQIEMQREKVRTD